jgi:hypothetical protein
MELIYFISGILTVGVVYGVILLRSVKSSHTELLSSFNKSSYISSTRRAELREELDDIKVMIMDIQSNMEKDQYESLTEINRRINELDAVAYKNLENANLTRQTNDGNFGKIFNEIQQVKTNIKTLGQDPNFVSRY